MHVYKCFIAYGNRGWLLAVARYSKERSRANDIIASIKAEELKSCARLRAFLYFIKNQDRLPWYEAR